MKVPCQLDAGGISLEVLKKAEKEDCLVIRLVETRGRVSRGTLTVADGASVVETDLLEWAEATALTSNGPMELVMQPFEIRTYKIRF